MAKHWKPDAEEDAAEARRRSVLGKDWAGRSLRRRFQWDGIALDRHEARIVLIVGILLGLAFAFLPPLFHRAPAPDVPMSRKEAQRIIAERTRERIGDGTMPVAPEPRVSFVEPRPIVVETRQVPDPIAPSDSGSPQTGDPVGM